MIKESYIINLLFKIYTWILVVYKNSLVYNFFMKVGFALSQLWNNSLAKVLMFKDFNTERVFQNSFIGKALNNGITSITKVTTKANSFIKNSYVITTIDSFISNILNIKISDFSYILATFSIVGISLKVMVTEISNIDIIIMSGVFIISIIFFFVRCSFKSLFKSSVLLKKFCDFFYIDIKDAEEFRISSFGFIVLGIILGVLYGLLPFTYFVLTVGGTGFLLITLSNLNFSIYVMVLVLPILPTKFTVAILSVMVLSFFIKVFITKAVSIKFTLTDFVVILFLGVTLYSVVISYIPSKSLFSAFLYTLFIFGYFIIKSCINSKSQLKTLTATILTSAFLVAFYGVLQRHTGIGVNTDAWVDSTMFEDLGSRIYSTLDNPNVLGEFLIVTTPIAFASLYYYKGFLNKFIAFVVLCTLGLALLYTGSRGAWLGTIIAFVVFAFLRDLRLVYLGLVGLAFSPFLLPESIVNRFLSIGNMGDSSTNYRVNIWYASLSLLKDYWIIGIGLSPSVFIYVYQKYAYSASYAQHSHQLFFQMGIELGIAGLLLFIGMIVLFFKEIFNNIYKEKDNFLKTFYIALAGGMLGYLAQGFTDNSWYNYRMVMYFFLMLALSSVYHSIKEETYVDDCAS